MSIMDEWGYMQFCSFSMTTKEDILRRIERERVRLSGKMQEEKDAAILSRDAIVDRMFKALYDDVVESNLFDLPKWDPKAEPEGVWRYQIELGPLGMKLQMTFVDGCLDNQNELGGYYEDEDGVAEATCFNVTDVYDVYDLFEEKSRLLTVEEYAALYDVKVVTVRQWIRRGKLRSAVKLGGEWRIPELASVPNKTRGYRNVYYTVTSPMSQFIEGFEDINNYNMIKIEKGLDNFYEISLKSSMQEGQIVKTVDTAAREKFEMYLISSGNVVCYDDNEEKYGYE